MHNFINKEVLNWRAFLQLKGQLSKDKRLQHFYHQGTYHEDTPISEIEFVALDFETTGLDAQKNSIISIGLVHFNLQRIFCRKTKSWYIDPQDNLQEDSIVIHGITHSDLNKAPDLLHILEQLLDEQDETEIVIKGEKDSLSQEEKYRFTELSRVRQCLQNQIDFEKFKRRELTLDKVSAVVLGCTDCKQINIKPNKAIFENVSSFVKLHQTELFQNSIWKEIYHTKSILNFFKIYQTNCFKYALHF